MLYRKFFLVKNCILNLNKFSKRTYASQLEKPTKELVVGLSTLMSTFLNKSCNYKRVSSSWDIYELREISKKKKIDEKGVDTLFFLVSIAFFTFFFIACLFILKNKQAIFRLILKFLFLISFLAPGAKPNQIKSREKKTHTDTQTHTIEKMTRQTIEA